MITRKDHEELMAAGLSEMIRLGYTKKYLAEQIGVKTITPFILYTWHNKKMIESGAKRVYGRGWVFGD